MSFRMRDHWFRSVSEARVRRIRTCVNGTMWAWEPGIGFVMLRDLFDTKFMLVHEYKLSKGT